MFIIRELQEVRDMARGAVLLGTGGGGDPYIGELFVGEQIKRGNFPKVIGADELEDDAFVLSIAGVGAPTVGSENLISEKMLMRLLAYAEAHFGRRVDALISAEIGGSNSIMPLALSAISGVPVLDADGIGRAMPQIEMTTFSIYGCPASPCILTDALGNVVTVDAISDRKVEDICRAVASALGAHVTSAIYPMTGKQAREVAVQRSLSLAYGIGRCIRTARESSSNIFDALLAYLNDWDGRHARILFDGKITDVIHETRDGWHWGQATLSGLGDNRDECVIEIRNEFLIARVNGEPVAMVPDLITVLDRETGEPLTGSMLAYGQRVKVLGYAADPMLCRPEALEVVGPRMFGIDLDFVPLAQSAAAPSRVGAKATASDPVA
jgi:DUF917 family protein